MAQMYGVTVRAGVKPTLVLSPDPACATTHGVTAAAKATHRGTMEAAHRGLMEATHRGLMEAVHRGTMESAHPGVMPHHRRMPMPTAKGPEQATVGRAADRPGEQNNDDNQHQHFKGLLSMLQFLASRSPADGRIVSRSGCRSNRKPLKCRPVCIICRRGLLATMALSVL